MTSPLAASSAHRPMVPPRFRSPVYRRYEVTIALWGILPVFFLVLKEYLPALVTAVWFQEFAAQVLTDCARTFFGAVFPGLFLLLVMAYSHPRLHRDECHVLLLIALFLAGGCIAVTRHLPL
jgi:hypothetical protein